MQDNYRHMKEDAINQFIAAVKEELDGRFPIIINGVDLSMVERVGRMHDFISISDQTFSDLYFSLLDTHADLKEEDLDNALAEVVQIHFKL